MITKTVIIVTILASGAGVAILGTNILRRRDRRKILQKEIAELATEIQTRKQKYPDWFQIEYINIWEDTISIMTAYSDRILDAISSSEDEKETHTSKMTSIKEAMWGWEGQYDHIQQETQASLQVFVKDRERLISLNQMLQKGNYQFTPVQIPEIPHGDNPRELLIDIHKASQLIHDSSETLSEIVMFYHSNGGKKLDIAKTIESKHREYTTTFREYVSVFRKMATGEAPQITEDIAEITIELRDAYEKRDTPKMRSIVSHIELIISPIQLAIDDMRQKIVRYDQIGRELNSRKGKIEAISINPEQKNNAKLYIEKNGDERFQNYDIAIIITRLRGRLDLMFDVYNEKKQINSITDMLAEFDREYNLLREYIES